MSAAPSILISIEFTIVYCCRADCRTPIALPTPLYRSLGGGHRHGQLFWCPCGHEQCFTGKSDAEKLREQLEVEKQRVETERKRVAAEQARTRRADLRANAFKGQVTRIRNRVGNGACPCCNRSFTNLQRHMHTKHPEYAKAVPTETDE